MLDEKRIKALLDEKQIKVLPDEERIKAQPDEMGADCREISQPGVRFDRIDCRETVDSTNTLVRMAAQAGAPQGLVITAEEQTDGRGRRGRSWASPAGSNLYFSVLLRPDMDGGKAHMLTLPMALAVAQSVRSLGQEAQIKWPNDVVLGGKKICGILTELYFDAPPSETAGGRGYYVVVGTGINVNQPQIAEELSWRATSLFLETGRTLDRERLLAEVLERFSQYYEIFLKTEDLGGLQKEYESLLANRGRQVEVLDPKGAWKGTALGIQKTGELLVRREDGAVEAVFAGEVSVRGIYGYV